MPPMIALCEPALMASDSPFAERLRKLRLAMRLTQAEMAHRLRISKGFEWMLENGTRDPGPRLPLELERLEESFQADRPPAAPFAPRAILLTDRPASTKDVSSPTSLRYIPVVSMAVAGRAHIAFEDLPADWQDRIPTDVSDPKAFSVEVRGDSMEPYIREPDRVILLPSQEVRNGDIVVACLRNGDILLKLYHESDKGKTVHLSSYNTIYPPVTYKRSDFSRIVPVDSVVKKVRH